MYVEACTLINEDFKILLNKPLKISFVMSNCGGF